MKVNAVSFTSSYKADFSQESRINRNYMYTTMPVKEPKKSHKWEYIGGLLAATVALMSLRMFRGRNTMPQYITDIADKNLGLNKITGANRTVKQLINDILYPMKAHQLGDIGALSGDFKTGLIFADKDSNKLSELFNAFIEHAQLSGIRCERIASKKKNKLREAHRVLDNALKYHQDTGACVIVDIGDLGSISKLNVCKTKCASNIEERLANMPKGILWTAYTKEADKLPYFYNNLPTLAVKIID